jgi:hypothetical protein
MVKTHQTDSYFDNDMCPSAAQWALPTFLFSKNIPIFILLQNCHKKTAQLIPQK